MLQILPHLEPNLEVNVTPLIFHLENLIEDVQLGFDHLRNKVFRKGFQLSNAFINLFLNQYWLRTIIHSNRKAAIL